MQENNMDEKPSLMLRGRGDLTVAEFSILVSLGVISILGWILMFSMGILINSTQYRNSVIKNFDWGNFIMSILTYTPTNIAILCVIASFSGGCASRMLMVGIAKKSGMNLRDPDVEKSDSQLYMNENPFGSMMRGLVLYFAYLAGVFIANSAPFAETSPQQYAQSAGIVSLFAFVVGFDPTVFRSLISISGKIKQNPK